MSVDDPITRLKACVEELENAFEDSDEVRQSTAITVINDVVEALIAERKRSFAGLIAQARDYAAKLVENESRFFPMEEMSALFHELADALESYQKNHDPSR